MKELISVIKNFPKHFKTAVLNIWRNGVMSFSSIFAVAITLLLIGVISVLAINVQNISNEIENGVSVYVKLDRTIDADAERVVGEEIQKLKGIKKIDFSTKDEELDKLIEKQGKDGKELFESYRTDNPLGSAYVVEVNNAKDLKKISQKIETIANVNSVNYGGSSTQSMVSTLDTIQKGGSIFVVALLIVAIFMISNTIKMTITTRQTEISIMRLVGASNWYIRIPFMLEGMLIGLIGSIVPIIILVYGYGAVYDYASVAMSNAMLALKAPLPFIRDFSFVIAGLGAIVGLVGSAISMRRFLKF